MELNDADVQIYLVGGYSVILHGYSRNTGDMDIWVEHSLANYKKIELAFLKFGMPLFDMTEEKFLHHPEWNVFTYGKPPSSIDIMTNVKGLSFEECFKKAIFFEEDGLTIRTIHLNNLLTAKKASNRPKDQQDIENLEP